MDERKPDFAAEIETLKGMYVALNRNDIPAFLDALDPEIEWTDPGESPETTSHRGHPAMRALLERARGAWAEGTCEPERFIVAGDRLVVFDHVHVRLQGHSEWIDAPVAAVYEFRNGKALKARVFAERSEALKWAGVDASDAA